MGLPPRVWLDVCWGGHPFPAKRPNLLGKYIKFLFFKINLFILFIYFWLRCVFVAACGLFSSCVEWGLLFVVVRGLLIAVASLVAEHGL